VRRACQRRQRSARQRSAGPTAPYSTLTLHCPAGGGGARARRGRAQSARRGRARAAPGGGRRAPARQGGRGARPAPVHRAASRAASRVAARAAASVRAVSWAAVVGALARWGGPRAGGVVRGACVVTREVLAALGVNSCWLSRLSVSQVAPVCAARRSGLRGCFLDLRAAAAAGRARVVHVAQAPAGPGARGGPQERESRAEPRAAARRSRTRSARSARRCWPRRRPRRPPPPPTRAPARSRGAAPAPTRRLRRTAGAPARAAAPRLRPRPPPAPARSRRATAGRAAARRMQV